MRRNLLKVSFLALALSLLASCGEADKVADNGKTNQMSDKVILARTQVDKKGISNGKIESIIVNASDIKSNEDIANAFLFNKVSTLSPENMSVLENTTSTNNCFGRRCVATPAPVWENNYYIGGSRCMVSAGCLWFPGKHILGAAGRILYTIGSGISGLGSGLWNGARGVGLDNPWVGANFSYRPVGCASVSCSTFYAPSYANTFVQDNYSYTRYSQVVAPNFSQVDYESNQSYHQQRSIY